ncbi:MAG: glycosyltransferase [Lachnospiraceae bacterium]|nr:glycosyltransferase [Lachnospiraceae bacterium]
MDVTVVIPVKNGGHRFVEVCERIQKQTGVDAYEVIVIDSGSTDDSVAVAKAAGFSVYEIPPEAFGHGKTRAYGASLGSGRYIVFITQDALPADTHWLENFVAGMDAMPQAAGGFGKHLPYPECNPVDRQMLQLHFENFLREDPYGGVESIGENRLFFLHDGNRRIYDEDAGYRQWLGFFSDNNAIIRRSAWEVLPYADVDFAEDQVWAAAAIAAGMKKAYIPSAVVYHSHDYPLKDYKARYYDDFASVYRVHGDTPCPTRKAMWHKILGDTKFNWGYIRRQTDYTFPQKIRWCIYALRRNCIRYWAAYQAAHEIGEKQ